MVSGCAIVPTPLIPQNPEKTREVLHVMREREASIQNLRGLFHASVTGPGVAISANFDGVVFYTRPNSVRMKGFTRVGEVIFDFVRNQDMYWLRFPGTGRLVKGHITELDKIGDLSQPVQLGLRAMDAVLGRVNGTHPGEIVLYKEGDRYRLEFPSRGRGRETGSDALTTRMWVDQQKYNLLQVDYLTQEGETAVTVECDDFRGITPHSSPGSSDIQLPFSISAENLQDSGSITLDFQELIANDS